MQFPPCLPRKEVTRFSPDKRPRSRRRTGPPRQALGQRVGVQVRIDRDQVAQQPLRIACRARQDRLDDGAASVCHSSASIASTTCSMAGRRSCAAAVASWSRRRSAAATESPSRGPLEREPRRVPGKGRDAHGGALNRAFAPLRSRTGAARRKNANAMIAASRRPAGRRGPPPRRRGSGRRRRAPPAGALEAGRTGALAGFGRPISALSNVPAGRWLRFRPVDWAAMRGNHAPSEQTDPD